MVSEIFLKGKYERSYDIFIFLIFLVKINKISSYKIGLVFRVNNPIEGRLSMNRNLRMGLELKKSVLYWIQLSVNIQILRPILSFL